MLIKLVRLKRKNLAFSKDLKNWMRSVIDSWFMKPTGGRDFFWRISWRKFIQWKKSIGNKEMRNGFKGDAILISFMRVLMVGGEKQKFAL